MLQYAQTPFQEIRDEQTGAAGVRLVIKREDLNHPYVSGNKWWKLKYNLQEAFQLGATTIVTYGGAFSNHILATAAAAEECGMKSIGIIRGEKAQPLNPVLAFAEARGMKLYFVQRSAYRQKSSHEHLQDLENCYVIPEGGSNALAVKGVAEFISSCNIDYNYICCPVGTGGTLSGIIESVPDNKMVLGFSVLKGGQFLQEEVMALSARSKSFPNWSVICDYHFGGYAKSTQELSNFTSGFTKIHSIPLDRIYTGKMLAGIYDLMKKGFFKRGSTILAIHTGGLQRQIFQDHAYRK
jgi:1-aminocyclopropane-1-carboxylate deaminase